MIQYIMDNPFSIQYNNILHSSSFILVRYPYAIGLPNLQLHVSLMNVYFSLELKQRWGNSEFIEFDFLSINQKRFSVLFMEKK